MDVSNRLALPFLAAAQAQKHVTHNEALRLLDAVVQIGVLERDRVSPPSSPAEGDRYVLSSSPAGLFAGHPGAVAAFDDGSWRFLAPRAGWIVYAAADDAVLVHDGARWRDLAALLRSLGAVQALAIGTGLDPGNPFSARLNDALFAARPSGEGGSGSLRLKLNKEGAAATASQIFQSGWSGRAETGLCGDDQYRVRVSADGAAWRDAIVVNPTTGAVSLPGGLADIAATTPSDFRNHVINGDFAIAQRGNGPFAVSQAAAYGFDRWLTQAAAACTAQVSRTAFAPGQADVPGARYFLTLAVTQTSATAIPALETRLEDVLRLAGRAVTVSFAYRTTSGACFCDLAQNFGGGGGSAVAGLSPLRLPASPGWTRRSLTAVLPSAAGRTVGAGSYTALRFAVAGEAAGSLDIAMVQVEEGPVATPFALRPPAVELLLARRFFRRYAAAQTVADLAQEMRATPVQSGSGPFDYAAEL